MQDIASRIDRYFHSIALSATIAEAIQITSEFLNRPIAVIDTAMLHIGHYPDNPTGDHDWDTLISNGYVHSTYAAVTRQSNAKVMPQGMLHRCVYSPASETEMEKYRCRLTSGSLHLGGMMVLGNHRPFTEEDITHLQIAIQTLSGCLHTLLEPHYASGVRLKHILSDLLEQDPHSVLARMSAHYPDLFALEGTPMVIGYTTPHPGDYDLAPFWQHGLSTLYPGTQVIQHNGSLIFFFPAGNHTYEAMTSALCTHFGHIHMSVGLSDCFTSFFHFRNAADNARLAYQTGCKTDPNKTLFTVRAYRLSLMVQMLGTHEAAKALCHPAILHLKSHDAENGTTYCKILYTYLLQFHNYSLAAKALFMHRNTLTYHLDRIQRILNLDLNDPEVCQILLISLMLINV